MQELDFRGSPAISATSPEVAHARVAAVFSQVFWWMGIGLALTAVTAMGVVYFEPLQRVIYSSPIVFYGLMIVELGLVWYLSARLATLSWSTALTLFLVYAGINGLTLSVLMLMYTSASIVSTFFVTAGMFGAMALYGTATKRDLTSWGSFLFMGLIGIILASIVNIFLNSSMLHWLVTFAGVGIFVGLTAYDTQQIKNMAVGNDMPIGKLAIYGALALYLDFINLFIMLLRLLGSRRD